MQRNSPLEAYHIVDVKDIIHSADQIFKYANKMRNAYENLLKRYDRLSINYVELKSARVTINSPKNLGHKRRKTDESVVNDSVLSNDPHNDAIQNISSCVEDEIIESTPKTDVTKKTAPKKLIGFKSPNKQQQIKLEKFDESTNSKASKDEQLLNIQQVKVEKNPESPLRSVENHHFAGKKNRSVKQTSKWLENAMVSPNRVKRAGFISAKSPRGKLRLSLSIHSKQTLLDFAKKPSKETEADGSVFGLFYTCAETFFDGTPRKPVGDSTSKFLRQQCLEACINSPKDSDDENVFRFKSPSKTNTTTTTSPPTIKFEPQTGQLTESNKVAVDNNQSLSGSSGSSVIALTCKHPEIIVIDESQPLFEDCTETFCDKLDFKSQIVQQMTTERKQSDDEIFVDNHNRSCDTCKLVMASTPHITMRDKLDMIKRCKPRRDNTDAEFWNHRMTDTPESQKQETLIDDRRTRSKKKT